jgi:uncharacterized delta-60 repeat protein
MRPRTAPALLLVFLALGPVALPAQGASPRGHLDRGFGTAGIASVVAPKDDHAVEGFTVGGDGRVYVLDGSSLLAFQSDGEVAGEFGEDGRVDVAPAAGEGVPVGLAVDSHGRLVVAGSIQAPILKYWPGYSTYVVRILPDGSRDPGFGSDGEVDTDFGLPNAGAGSEGPSVSASSIVADARDRPVIGGSYGETAEPCGVNFDGGPAPFLARLTTSGGLDQTFGKAGTTVFKGKGSVTSVEPAPAGALMVFSRACATPPREETRSPIFIDVDNSGNVGSPVMGGELPFTWIAPAVDPKGRVLALESPPPAAVEYEPNALVRLRPNGRPDPSFGRRGRVVLRDRAQPSAFAVDPEGRPVVASATGLRRFRTNGKLDRGFGRGGRLKAKIGAPSAITFDAAGRIYTVSLPRNPSQPTVKVARFIPGR